MTSRVLVVDDNAGYRLLVRVALTGSAFAVVGEAADLDEARRLAVRVRPDVVLVDLHLPKAPAGSGIAALREAAGHAVFLSVSSLSGVDVGGNATSGMALLPRRTPPGEIASVIERAIAQRTPDDVHDVVRVRLPPEPSSAGEARRFARGALGRWGCSEDVEDTVLLLLSEVVSNAVLHARTELEVNIAARPAQVRVEVVDGDTSPIHRRTSTAEAQSGRGTELIEVLAEAWGTDRLTTGKRVWFEVAAPELARS